MSSPTPPPPPPPGGTPPPPPPPGGGFPPAAPPPPPGGGFPPPPPPPGVAPAGGGNNGMAIASLVCALVGVCCGVGSILGIIFGFIALNQIKRTGQGGAGMAKAGIIIGFVLIALWIIYVIVMAATGNSYYYWKVG